MPRYRKCPRLSLEQVFQDPIKTQRWMSANFPPAEEEQKEEEEEEEEEVEEEEEEGEEEEEQEEEESEEEEGQEEESEEEETEEEEGQEEESEEEETEEEEGQEEESEEDEEEEEEDDEEGPEASDDDDTNSSRSSWNASLSSFCPSPSSTSSSSSLSIWGTPHERERPVAGMLRLFHGSQSSYSISWNKSNSQEEDEDLSPLHIRDIKTLRKKLQNQRVTDLVNFLILKYRMKEPITKLEMFKVVTKACKKQFPIIFKRASKCLEVIFGIEIRKSDPVRRSYVLVNSLNLTFEDIMTSDQRLPRNGFLIVILGVIFIEGNCASEKSIWEFLNTMGIYDGEEHFIYGEPREFLTKDLVQQNYLEYRQVPNSCPPHYEFLWGPRAHSETTKMKVLEFLARVTRKNPGHFSFLYSEAFRDEEERAWTRRNLLGSTTLVTEHWAAVSPTHSEESVVESVYWF